MNNIEILKRKDLDISGYYNIIIGMNNETHGFNNCILIGHSLHATENNQLLISDKKMCEKDCPEAFELIRKGVFMMHKLLS